MMDKISVITVCYNAEATIESTIKSVLEQTYGNLEYLIIDGMSIDGTLEIVEQYRPLFEKKGMEYHVISERDNGIYNAMNKGIHMATGEWIIFMNADDTFFDGSVISDLFENSVYENYDAIYGNYHRIDGQGSYFTRSNTIETLPKRMPFMHQSIFTRTTLCRRYEFDENYHLCADYDMFFRMYADGHQFHYTERVICNYSISGISGRQRLKAQDEVISIKKRFASRFPISVKDRAIWGLERMKMQIKCCLPEKFLTKIRFLKYIGG